MKAFKNTQKQNYLAQINTTSIEDAGNDLSFRCKFNFSYFTVHPAGQDFSGWTHLQLVKLLEKLKNYGKESLSHWRAQMINALPVLAVYGAFPKNTAFSPPNHIPHQAEWARFRLESSVRLIGFILPAKFHDIVHEKTGKRFDCNTFYVVFLDQDHLFYKTEKK